MISGQKPACSRIHWPREKSHPTRWTYRRPYQLLTRNQIFWSFRLWPKLCRHDTFKKCHQGAPLILCSFHSQLRWATWPIPLRIKGPQTSEISWNSTYKITRPKPRIWTTRVVRYMSMICRCRNLANLVINRKSLKVGQLVIWWICNHNLSFLKYPTSKRISWVVKVAILKLW